MLLRLMNVDAKLSRDRRSDTMKFFPGKQSWSDATVPVRGGGQAGRGSVPGALTANCHLV